MSYGIDLSMSYEHFAKQYAHTYEWVRRHLKPPLMDLVGAEPPDFQAENIKKVMHFLTDTEY